jgi:hypothetical protein
MLARHILLGHRLRRPVESSRWNVLQHYKKRFFAAPVLISARDKGARVQLWVSNGDANRSQETSNGSLQIPGDRRCEAAGSR